MTKLNVHEAKTHLSHYLDLVEQGETLVLCRRNKPIAELRPIAPSKPKRRELGRMKGLFQVPASFFEPLPDDELALWSGEGE